MDRDGLADLVIGELNNNQLDPSDPQTIIGNLNFFKNIGTDTAPSFDPDPDAAGNNKVLGHVLTFDPGFFTGNSAPRFIDFDGTYRLFCGSTSGKLKVYTNIEGNLDGAFTRSFNNYGNLSIGIEIRPDFADLNDDGVIDMIVGNKRGGLSAFVTSFRTDGSVPTKEITDTPAFQIYPNPSRDGRFYVEWEGALKQTQQMRIVDALGREVYTGQLTNPLQQIDISSFAEGIYFVEIRDGERRRLVEKLIISR